MNRETHLPKRMTTGGITLFMGNVAASLISAITTILVARLLGPENYGLFSLSLVVPGILQLFPTLGLNVAATRYVAFLSSQGQQERARLLVSRATFLVSICGIFLSVAGFLVAGSASSYLLHRDSLVPYLRILSVSIIGQAVIQMGTSVAVGRYAMGAAVATNILQSFFKLVAAPLLLVAGFGLEGAVTGYAASFIVAAAFIVVVLAYSRDFVPFSLLKKPLDDTREMFRYALPAFLGSLLVGALTFFLPVILASIASNAAIGYFQAAYNVLVPLTLLSSAVAMTLLPVTAAVDGAGGDLAAVLRGTLRYYGYLSIPMLLLLMSEANQLMYLLYGSSFNQGAGYLVLLCLANTPMLFGLNVMPSFFNGAGKPRITLMIVGLAAATFFFLAPLLSEFGHMGVEGLILALFLSNSLSAAAGMYFARAQINTDLDYYSALSALAASLLAFGAASLVPHLPWATLVFVLKFLVFCGVYLISAPLLGAVSVSDLDRLMGSVEDYPVLGTVALWVIAYQRKLATRSLRRGAALEGE